MMFTGKGSGSLRRSLRSFATLGSSYSIFAMTRCPGRCAARAAAGCGRSSDVGRGYGRCVGDTVGPARGTRVGFGVGANVGKLWQQPQPPPQRAVFQVAPQSPKQPCWVE